MINASCSYSRDWLAARDSIGGVQAFQHDQRRVGNRLSGKTGADGAESYRHLMGAGQLEQCDHLRLSLDSHHQLGDQAFNSSAKSTPPAHRVANGSFGRHR